MPVDCHVKWSYKYLVLLAPLAKSTALLHPKIKISAKDTTNAETYNSTHDELKNFKGETTMYTTVGCMSTVVLISTRITQLSEEQKVLYPNNHPYSILKV